MGSGFCVSGHVETGMISLGDKILILPRNETAVIKSIKYILYSSHAKNMNVQFNNL